MIRIRKRVLIPKRFYHIYNRGNRKQRIFNFPSDRKYLIRKIRYLASECRILIPTFCLMDNHFHLILKQESDISISKFMQRLMTSYCVYFNRRYNLTGHLFQDRFKSRMIKNLKDLGSTVLYIANNPVTAEYVKDPNHYAWFYIKKEFEKYLLRQT